MMSACKLCSISIEHVEKIDVCRQRNDRDQEAYIVYEDTIGDEEPYVRFGQEQGLL